LTGRVLENTLFKAAYCIFVLDIISCLYAFPVFKIRSSCEIHLQKIAVRVLKLARTYAKFCGEHDGGVVGFDEFLLMDG
jgi:hypothetical protein